MLFISPSLPQAKLLIISTITTLNPVLLIIRTVRLLLGIVAQLLAVVEVLAVGLDQLVGFAGGETGHDVFRYGVVFGDTWRVRRVGVSALVCMEGGGVGECEAERRGGERGDKPFSSSCFWYCLMAMKPAPAARTSCPRLPWLSGCWGLPSLS